MKRRTIIKIVTFIILFFGIWKCTDSLFYNKRNHLHTDEIGSGIYEERFKPFSGGVLMNDTRSYYLTDSINFRILLGQCDEEELYRCEVLGDTIKAIKYSRRIRYGKEMPIDSVYFSIKDLKNEKSLN
ncbi:hypothetical protein LZD49_24655 [Dyadobacter sp. CY261]|uniref:hypothetical protein n=1 Tax=Dyadobacter sp. CY261 TaxID=2907203 RepID=UPI001F22EA41|nr:hypothetical protein [Dyadobacter sp. CY261]MCF0073693.1 hypothetical protein [Dyadobacter sp. CY261]